MLALGAAFLSAVSSDVVQQSNEPLFQGDKTDKILSLLAIIRAVRKLEHELHENEQRLDKRSEALEERSRLENSLQSLHNILNAIYKSTAESDQQKKIANVLRNIQVCYHLFLSIHCHRRDKGNSEYLADPDLSTIF